MGPDESGLRPDALADSRCRGVLSYLRTERRCTVRELTEHVAASARDRPGAPTLPELDRTFTALAVGCLPLLDDAGVIEWDREADEIRKGPRFAEIRPLLELLDDHREELPSDWL